MSRRIEKCHICKGAGLITVDDWLTKGMTEEQIAKEKEEALADIVEVVRCKDCKFWGIREGNDINKSYFCSVDKMWCMPTRKADDFCSYGERRE